MMDDNQESNIWRIINNGNLPCCHNKKRIGESGFICNKKCNIKDNCGFYRTRVMISNGGLK